ncbi:MAG: histidine phosphatase family protein [Sphingomonadales bacterium]|nr:histidine phosphatase family protein [Sphingomonadales bacterium]MBD3773995.1 histidine phosphatase family protein [Paracoccaceae bacterium]
MKILGILRHAKSDWDDSAKRDFDRGLNGRGQRGAELIGRHIRDHGIKWDKVIASPAERVKATLEIGLPELDVTWDKQLYLASPQTILDILREEGGDADRVLVSGHNPGLQELLFALIPPANENDLFHEAVRKFPTAAYAVVELDIDDWHDLSGDCGKLVHFARPRDLDPELGPERA